MERTKKNILKDFFSGIGEAFSNFINGGEVNDATLTGELAVDPMVSLEKFQEQANVNTNQTVQQTAPRRTRTIKTQKQAPKPQLEKDEDELEH